MSVGPVLTVSDGGPTPTVFTAQIRKKLSELVTTSSMEIEHVVIGVELTVLHDDPI